MSLDGDFGDQGRLVFSSAGEADFGEHAGGQNAILVFKNGAGTEGGSVGIKGVADEIDFSLPGVVFLAIEFHSDRDDGFAGRLAHSFLGQAQIL